ncbi:extracellular solute-binding protein [Paenibacillus sp. YN15]|uniref:extracellular solute-binding protein n=1 Tax=Paenibacillus sp. YN15 TaxID=1742774 RepID=UPI000DCBCE5F|nr:extracellular solute-binding protein [Paenibacillus sp. YN15]RAU92158.1 ABC transporter substrate-binding protein [Paenibacillus sp. YN15]
MPRHGGLNKTGAAIIIFVLIASILAACSSGTGSNGSSESGATSAPAAAAGSSNANAGGKQPETVEITVWDKPAPNSTQKSIQETLFAKFDELYPHIKVTHQDITQSKEKFMAAVAGGQQPDVFFPSFPDMQVYIGTGIVADITDLVNESNLKDTFIEGAFDLATEKGKIYGVPTNMYTTGLYYNKKLFANAGITKAPETWEKFIEVAKAVQNANPGTTGFDILGMDWADWHFEYYAWQAGGDLTELQPDGTVKLTFDSEPVVKALQYYKDLKWTHQVVQNNVLQSVEENNKDFYTGKAAMILGATDSFTVFVGKGMDPDDIGFAPYPKGPAGISLAQAGGQFAAISPTASPEKKKAAFEYIKFMTSKESKEAQLQFSKDNGLGVNPLSILRDIDTTQYIEDMPQDFVAAIKEAAKNQRLEYYLKSSLSPYIVKPIQKVLLDKNTDPLTELKAAQDLAQKEVVDKFNEDVLSKKK